MYCMMFELSGDAWLVIVGVLVLLLQILLCLKVKKLWIRLIPAVVFFALTVVFTVLLFVSEGWDAIGYLLLAIFFAVFLAASVVGWVIAAIVKAIMARKNKR